MVVGFTTTYAIGAYHHWWVRGITLCDKVCQWLAAGWWFSPGLPVSSSNKTDRHNITEILLKVALKTIKPTNQTTYHQWSYEFQSRSWHGVFDTTLGDKVGQWLATGQWFSAGPSIYFLFSNYSPFNIWSFTLCNIIFFIFRLFHF